MHFVFTANWSKEGTWVAGCIVQSDVIITEAKTEEELRIAVKAAIEVFLGNIVESGEYSFDIEFER